MTYVQLTPSFIFLFQVLVLYFVAQKSINSLFSLLRIFFRSDRIVFSFISFFFLPGTIMHELAHFLFAVILFLRVYEVKIIPEWEGNSIKLGHVLYGKKDIFRGIMVGIAPFFAGLGFFFFLSTTKIFPNSNLYLTILLGYLIFVVSTTMFSSKQDLIDIGYLIPIGLLIAVFCYIFNINLMAFFRGSGELFPLINNFLYTINYYAFFSILIHLGVIVIVKLVKIILKK